MRFNINSNTGKKFLKKITSHFKRTIVFRVIEK
ncbi:hypothetical protein AB210_0361 [Acinetobacter baumannii AB210]|nr:hypothetical protein AB210_0361 [Acinetobacter baumannii AB210]